MSEDSIFSDSLRKNRNIFLVVLLLPVVGMVVAIPLIIWREPKHMMIVLGAITLLIIQYTLLVFWISKRIDQIIKS
jgi:type II secretory pathway component PulM